MEGWGEGEGDGEGAGKDVADWFGPLLPILWLKDLSLSFVLSVFHTVCLFLNTLHSTVYVRAGCGFRKGFMLIPTQSNFTLLFFYFTFSFFFLVCMKCVMQTQMQNIV